MKSCDWCMGAGKWEIADGRLYSHDGMSQTWEKCLPCDGVGELSKYRYWEVRGAIEVGLPPRMRATWTEWVAR